MSRRRFLKAGVAAAGALPWSRLARAASAPAVPLTRLGAPQPFDYARLKGVARSLAAAPYQPPTDELPPAVAALDWDHWQAIRFRDDHSLWVGDGLRFQVRFSISASPSRSRCDVPVENGHAQEIRYDPAMFDYSSSGVEGAMLSPSNLGFAGFRLLFHTDWMRDFAAFQGASYFRAVDGDLQYGMSQRGLAIDCGAADPEEFPDFVAYYLERPAKDSSRAHRLRTARLPERRRRLSIRDRCRRHAHHGYRCGAVSAQADRADRHRARAPACSSSGRTTAVSTTTGVRRFTTPTACRSGPAAANGSGGR